MNEKTSNQPLTEPFSRENTVVLILGSVVLGVCLIAIFILLVCPSILIKTDKISVANETESISVGDTNLNENPQRKPLNVVNAAVREGALAEATLTGYYYKRRIYGHWSKGEPFCDSLVVLDGTPEFVEELTDMVRNGDKINELNERGVLIINLPSSDLTAEQKSALMNSTTENLLTLKVARRIPVNEAIYNPCYSYVGVMEIDTGN